MKKIVLGIIVTCMGLLAGEINVAAAANLSYVIEELKAEFAKSHPQTKVTVNLGSSGKFTAQIKNGAPFGMFMSADMKFPTALFEGGFTLSKPKIYAQGALVLLAQKSTELSGGLSLLKGEAAHKIAIANPKTAPYGAAALEAFKKAGIYEAIAAKLVQAESISQVVSFTQNAADFGLTAASLLHGDALKSKVEGKDWVMVDPALYTPIAQGAVLLKAAKGNAEYEAFYAFIYSGAAAALFRKYGYIVR
ncbi:MAG: molybdate ABC transporter substrate-binding protein [Campylobacterales bacterium]|nr:molybdate ABC transporter substrate-binding protein [Campylobacterales bacterium]